MTRRTIASLMSLLLFAMLATANTQAAGFTEDFTFSREGWISRTFAPLTHNATGGPDGGAYVSFNGSFAPFAAGAVAFRGHEDFAASGNAFTGDWLTKHWIKFSAYVRHNGPAPAEFFARIANEFNFPAVAIENGVLVQPNTWTLIEFSVNKNNPLLTAEDPNNPTAFEDLFSDVGNVQIGLTAPAGFGTDTTPIVFALDKVTVAIPEPASCGLLMLGTCVSVLRRRK